MADLQPLNLSDAVRLAAEEHPDVPFLADAPWAAGGRIRTQGDLEGFVNDFADRLWAAGVRSGDRVAIVKRDHIDIQIIACSAIRIGAVPALLSSRMDPDELLSCLDRLERPVVLFDRHAAERFQRIRDELGRVSSRLFAVGDGLDGWPPPLVDRVAHTPASRPVDELAIINHSSGTTGVPKLIGQSSASLFVHASPTIRVYRTMGDNGFSVRCVSFTHTRTSSALLGILVVGSPFVGVTDPRPDHVKALLLTHRPGTVEAHPNLYLLWEGLTADPDRPFGSVSRYVSTFDAMHPRIVRALLAASDRPDAVYIQGYGQTETGPIAVRVVTRDDLGTWSGRAVGRPMAGLTEFRVVDEAGSPMGPGEVGRIEARTRGLSRGYVGPGTTPPARDAWWPMQDVGRMLDNGELELLDRVVDRIDGRTSLLELEDAMLDALPELVEVVLVAPEPGRPVAVACVRDGAPLDRDRWRAVAERHGLADVPVREWRWEDLPFTGSWKVRRHRLAAAVRQRADAAA